MSRTAVPLYLVALMIYVIAGTPLAPFHGDESTLIYGTRDYFEQFVTPDMPRVMNLRDDDPMDHNLRLLDGRVQLYFGGFVYHLAGGTQADLNQPWLWGAPTHHNVENGHMPGDHALMTQRFAMALLAALSIPAAYGVGAHLGGIAGGLLMATLTALSPNLMLNGRRVMMEAPMLLFSLLTVLAALQIAADVNQPLKLRRVWLFFALFGLVTGMAVASKHTAVLNALPLFGVFGIWFILRRDWRRFAGLFGAGVLALAVFFALNPAWWATPFDTAREMLALRSDLLRAQTDGVGGYATAGDYLRGFIDYAVIEQPQYAEIPDWQETGPSIAAYEASPFVLPPVLNLLRALVTAILAACGIWALARRRDGIGWLAGAWVAFMLITTVVLTPLPWARYYLPALPAIYALSAAGIGWLTKK